MEFLVLEVDGARFGIPTSDVREVLRAVSLSAAPAQFPNVAGMLNYRGQVLGVLELSCLRGRTHHDLSPHEHFIVVQSAGHLFALRVDQAVEIMTWADANADESTRPPASNKNPPKRKDQPNDNHSTEDKLDALAHPRLGVVYLLDTDALWSEMHLEPSHVPTQEVEAL